ncbi:hypothetical protein [Desulforhopalus sp. 52FAK]
MKKKIKKYLWGFLSLGLGLYLSYLCIENIGRMGLDIFNPEAQDVTLRHSWGEDLSQFILSLVGAVVCFATSFGYLVLFKEEELFYDDE